MEVDLVFVVILLGHVLADFYFQSQQLAEDKKTDLGALFLHCVFYAVIFTVTNFLCISPTENRSKLVFSAALAHFVIDFIKFLFTKNQGESKRSYVKRYIFIVDQLLHFVSLIVIWYWQGRNETVKWFVSQEFENWPYLPFKVLLGVLCILKPVSLLITSTSLWEQKNSTGKIEQGNLKAGEIIGYLERLIIFFLLIYSQFGAIAFVLTAKSLARFKEIEQDQDKAEYYLIGTLLSVASAFTITILLGLCSKE